MMVVVFLVEGEKAEESSTRLWGEGMGRPKKFITSARIADTSGSNISGVYPGLHRRWFKGAGRQPVEVLRIKLGEQT
jgi:hypothetical protein